MGNLNLKNKNRKNGVAFSLLLCFRKFVFTPNICSSAVYVSCSRLILLEGWRTIRGIMNSITNNTWPTNCIFSSLHFLILVKRLWPALRTAICNLEFQNNSSYRACLNSRLLVCWWETIVSEGNIIFIFSGTSLLQVTLVQYLKYSSYLSNSYHMFSIY